MKSPESDPEKENTSVDWKRKRKKGKIKTTEKNKILGRVERREQM